MKKLLFITLLAAQCASVFAMEQSAQKKQKIEEKQEKKELIVYPKAYFTPHIEDAIKNLMVTEEGPIWAAYYRINADNLTSWWAGRKYIQEFEKARARNDINAIMKADIYKTSPKDDLLIVDREAGQQDANTLNKLSQAGIQVLIQNKRREPSNAMQKMHHKFMIFFDKEIGKGKLLINGSYNMTNQASKYNCENIIVYNDAGVIAQFIEQHKDLKKYCSIFIEKKSPQPNDNEKAVQVAQVIPHCSEKEEITNSISPENSELPDYFEESNSNEDASQLKGQFTTNVQNTNSFDS